MDTRARLRLLATGVATMAALGALAAPATAGAASKKKRPVVTRVAPLTANVGETLTIYGKNFRKGKARNSVAFKAKGKKALFLTSDVSTKRRLKVELTDKLERGMTVVDGLKVPTKFRIRVQAKRFGKRYTFLSGSPTIGPRPKPGTTPPPGSRPPVDPDGDCDGDGVKNSGDADDDGDLLSDALEKSLKTDQCKADTDGDGVQDGYEYKSAIDYNDDEFQQPNQSLPHPNKMPYPNPLDDSDAGHDFDGDGLTLHDEYELWVFTWDPKRVRPNAVNPLPNKANQTLFPLTYSDGRQYSVGRPCASGDADSRCDAGDVGRWIPTQVRTGYQRQQMFLDWAQAAGYLNVRLTDAAPWFDHAATRNAYHLLDFNRSGGAPAETVDQSCDAQAPGPGFENCYFFTERWYFDRDDDGYLSDDERDEDADGLTNWDESHGRMTREYWAWCYGDEVENPLPYRGTDLVDPDTDGDGVRDGADDQDQDDVPNVMELSRNAASGLVDGACNNPIEGLPEPEVGHHENTFGWVHPYDPCLPLYADAGGFSSPTCKRTDGPGYIPNPFNGEVLNWVSLH